MDFGHLSQHLNLDYQFWTSINQLFDYHNFSSGQRFLKWILQINKKVNLSLIFFWLHIFERVIEKFSFVFEKQSWYFYVMSACKESRVR